MNKISVVRGHILVGDKDNKATCSCGEVSPWLLSRAKRREWHRNHKAGVASQSTMERAFGVMDPEPAIDCKSKELDHAVAFQTPSQPDGTGDSTDIGAAEPREAVLVAVLRSRVRELEAKLGPLSHDTQVAGFSGGSLRYVIGSKEDMQKVGDGLHALAVVPLLRKALRETQERLNQAEAEIARVREQTLRQALEVARHRTPHEHEGLRVGSMIGKQIQQGIEALLGTERRTWSLLMKEEGVAMYAAEEKAKNGSKG